MLYLKVFTFQGTNQTLSTLGEVMKRKKKMANIVEQHNLSGVMWKRLHQSICPLYYLHDLKNLERITFPKFLNKVTMILIFLIYFHFLVLSPCSPLLSYTISSFDISIGYGCHKNMHQILSISILLCHCKNKHLAYGVV